MGSIRFEGVHFSVFSDDHEPVHVHARYADVKAIVELDRLSRRIRIRDNSTKPSSAKRADLRHILRMADQHFAELVSIWEELHG